MKKCSCGGEVDEDGFCECGNHISPTDEDEEEVSNRKMKKRLFRERKKCGECDCEVSDDDVFCGSCGERLHKDEDPDSHSAEKNRKTKNNAPVYEFVNHETGEVLWCDTSRIFGRNDFICWKPNEETEPRISRKHFEIRHRGGEFQIIDLDSMNGTWVNDERLNPNEPASIGKGDIVKVAAGYLKFTFNPL
jgi:hypothetical protein